MDYPRWTGAKYEKAESAADLPPYVCEHHGPDPNPVVHKRKNGYVHRRCRECYKIIQRPLNRDWLKRNRARCKALVIEAYGGKCECCSESIPGLLSIDHAKNDGKAHRAEMGGPGSTIYAWLVKNGFPKDGRFRLLCYSCNLGRAFNGGICPHVELKS
jgi:hypothetical protein